MMRRLFWAAALVLVAAGVLRGSATTQPAPGLLSEPPADMAPPLGDAPARPDTVQARAVAVNMTALEAEAVDLDLDSGTRLRAVLDRRSQGLGGAAIWSGRIDGAPFSTATFVQVGTILQGSIRTLDAAYSIEPLPGTTLHVVRQLNLGALGAELPPLIPDPPPAHDGLVIAGDDGTTFDVLAVYTPAARTAAGGTDQAMLARINLGISETNTAYASSGVIPRLRLVGAEAVSYTESGDLSIDLSAVTGTLDGQMDSVHTLRNTVGADLVTLVVGSAAGGACGVAWLMENLSSGFATSAFSVTAYECISPNYTFGHELGHNLGSNHAPDDPVTATPLYAYSFGYKHPANTFRTVMAYNCAAGCPRVLSFSNPAVSYGGAPTGTPGQHNNATSINNARNTIANWRQAVGPNTAPTSSAIANQTTNEDTPTPALAFTVGDAQTSASSLVVTASSPNTALVADTSAALALSGSGANRTLVVTPQPNASGSATITVTVSDGSLSSSTSFVLTVNPVNDTPVVTPTPSSATTPNGTAISISVLVNDVDSAGSSMSLTTSNSNQALLPNANIQVSTTATGATSRTFQVTMTPAAGQQGTVTVMLYGFDGAATGIAAFILTVSPPASPTITPVSPQTIDEDTATGAIAFTVGDPDTPAGSLAVSATSSNTALVPNTSPALALAGTGANRTLTVTPLPNQSGGTTITVTVSDGARTAFTTFGLTVLAVNDPPAITAVAAQATDEDVPLAVSFTVSDIDTPAAGLTVQAHSSNVALIGPAGLLPGGSGAARTLTMMPAANQHGLATITLTVSDGALSSATSFQLTVNPVNDAPVPVGLPPLVSTTMGGEATFTATVSDVDSAGASLTLDASSTNATLLPPGGILVEPQSSTADTRTFLVTLTPAVSETGTTGVVLTAGDQSLTSTVTVTFNVTATPVPPNPPTSLSVGATGTSVVMAWVPALTGAAPSSFVAEIGTAPGTTTLPTQSVTWPTSSLTLTLPQGTYYVRVRAVNAVNSSAPSPEASVTVVEPSPIPGPPANFSAATFGRSVRFSWSPSAVGAPASTYRIEAGTAPGLANITTIDTGSLTTVFEVANVPPGTYWVRARAANVAGAGAPSQDVSIVMGASAGCVGLPEMPVLLSPVVTDQTVTLSWNPPGAGGAPTSYVLMAGSASGLSNLASFSTGGTGTSFATSAPGGLYFVRVAASNACGVGPASNEVPFNLGPQPPEAPSNLAFSLAPGGMVTLSWDAPAAGEPMTSYMVEAGSAPALANLASVSTGSTTPAFAATAPAGTYFVRVRALNSTGASAASNEVTIVVP